MNSNVNNAGVDLSGATLGGSSTAIVDQSGALGGSASSNMNVQGSLNNNVDVTVANNLQVIRAPADVAFFRFALIEPVPVPFVACSWRTNKV